MVRNKAFEGLKRGGLSGALILFCVFCAVPANAGSRRPVVDEPFELVDPEKIIELNLTPRSRGPVTTPAYVDGKGPLKFVVDTGIWRSGVSRAAISRHKISHEVIGAAQIAGVDQIREMRLLRVPSLRVGELEGRNWKMLELPGILGSARYGIHGALGSDFYSSFVVYFNLYKNKLMLYPAETDLTASTFNKFAIIPMRYNRSENGIFASIEINSVPMRAMIDTGATTTLVDIKYKNKLQIDTSASYYESSTGVHGQSVRFLRVKVDSIAAEDKTWAPAGIGLVEFTSSSRRFNAVIGMDLLGKAAFAVDYERNRILILEKRQVRGKR